MAMEEDLPLVLLDTNALLMPFQLGMDLEGEIERVLGRCRIAVPEAVMAELRSMPPTLREARAALQLAGRFETLPSRGMGDDAVLELASREGAVVVTGDRGLIDRLREAGLRVLRPRQRTLLELK
jgi:rRNA-processing protein FCF1